MIGCLHNGHSDIYHAKIPKGGRTGRMVSITILLRQRERNFIHSEVKNAHLNPVHNSELSRQTHKVPGL